MALVVTYLRSFRAPPLRRYNASIYKGGVEVLDHRVGLRLQGGVPFSSVGFEPLFTHTRMIRLVVVNVKEE